ncbi:MAG: 4Fe-4S binding protein [Candidatus Bathyarchaeota archaeon]|nr:MAG: 4Fe-4S binding protein [Candidatus Bathyarchaeota archaeon]
MPMRIRKSEAGNCLIIERTQHAKKYRLVIDRKLCVGCELCSLVCPREALETKRQLKQRGQKAACPTVDVEETKCDYCGICSAICPFGAAQVNIDGRDVEVVVEKESFPQLIHEISVDTEKCPPDCVECEKACPLEIISVKSNPKTKSVIVDAQEEKCPACHICEAKCPEDAIHIRNIFTGKLKINREKCPSSCQDCLDVCPIPNALYLSDKDGKIYVNEQFCTYCGACRIACPEEGALELSRATIYHTPVRSGAWNKALEKLTSTTEMTKELRGKGRKRTMEAVKRRMMERKK